MGKSNSHSINCLEKIVVGTIKKPEKVRQKMWHVHGVMYSHHVPGGPAREMSLECKRYARLEF